MRIAFLWTRPSGYMASCWRRLSQQSDLSIKVIAYGLGNAGELSPFDDEQLMAGLDAQLLDVKQREDVEHIKVLLRENRPDILVVSGWLNAAYCKIVLSQEFRDTPVIMTMDNPWLGTWRQRLAKYRLRSFLQRINMVVVAGERTWQYAQHLGVPETRLRRGTYGFDEQAFRAAADQRANGQWPRVFLYVGRYASTKGLSVLRQAYATYRESVDDPWTLATCGRGPDAKKLVELDGVEDHGFTQPTELPDKFAEAGAFILPSLYEPWGVVLAEAAGSGLPVICTEACGAGVDLIHSYYSGIKVATGNSKALAEAMRWMHEHHDRLPEMGRRGQHLAAAYSAEAWADRWREYLREAAQLA